MSSISSENLKKNSSLAAEDFWSRKDSYLAILGRISNLSEAELAAQFDNVHTVAPGVVAFTSKSVPNLRHLGGTLKIAVSLGRRSRSNDSSKFETEAPELISPLSYLKFLPSGKITFGISDYSVHPRNQTGLAINLKKTLKKLGRSVRVVVESKSSESHQDRRSPLNNPFALSTATSFHNGFGAGKSNKVEFVKVGAHWFRVISVQNIDAYASRDQKRPARDAKVGMLPPKLAQILINLTTLKPPMSEPQNEKYLSERPWILDPFCGTGVLLQEALLMGFNAYGTDLEPRMIDYSRKNLEWLKSQQELAQKKFENPKNQKKNLKNLKMALKDPIFDLSVGDAMSFSWKKSIDAVATECYLGAPMSKIPPEIKLKEEKEECREITTGFLKNLATQIKKDTPVVIAIPAWLRPDGNYESLFDLENSPLDFFSKLGYYRINYGEKRLLYYREGQIVAREIIILRKK